MIGASVTAQGQGVLAANLLGTRVAQKIFFIFSFVRATIFFVLRDSLMAEKEGRA